MEGTQLTSGDALKWCRDNFTYTEMRAAKNLNLDFYNLISLEASESPDGSNGLIFFPFPQGQSAPSYDDYAKGEFIGI